MAGHLSGDASLGADVPLRPVAESRFLSQRIWLSRKKIDTQSVIVNAKARKHWPFSPLAQQRTGSLFSHVTDQLGIIVRVPLSLTSTLKERHEVHSRRVSSAWRSCVMAVLHAVWFNENGSSSCLTDWRWLALDELAVLTRTNSTLASKRRRDVAAGLGPFASLYVSICQITTGLVSVRSDRSRFLNCSIISRRWGSGG